MEMLTEGVRRPVSLMDCNEQDIAPLEQHIIFEYDKGDRLRGISAPRNNRVILNNGSVPFQCLDASVKAIESASASVIVLSGYHTLDNIPVVNRSVMVDKYVSDFINRLPSSSAKNGANIHIEMASMAYENGAGDDMMKIIKSGADSLGMNEQELLYIARVLQINITSDVLMHPNKTVSLAMKIFDTIYAKQSVSNLSCDDVSYPGLPPHVIASTLAFTQIPRCYSGKCAIISCDV